MVDLQAGISPVGIQGQHITVEEQQLGMAPSALNQNNDGKDYHVRAGRVHRCRPGHFDTPSSSGSITGAITGLTGSDTFPVSASEEATKEMKGKETEFLNRDIVDLTVDSPLQNMKRSAFALDSVSAESPEFPAFKRQHHRTSRTNRLPTLSGQSNPHQMPSEAEISVSDMRPGIRRTLRKELTSRPRLILRTSLPPAGKPDTGMEPRDKETALPSEADDVLGDAQLNTVCLGASFSERGDTTRPLPKNKGVLAHAVESHGGEGEPSVATGLDCKLMGRISSEPEGLLPSKHTRSPAKSRQRFRPPRMVSSGSASGSSLGRIQKLIDVDDWETSKSSGVTKDFKIPETARQIEQDEMLAKFLQEEYSLKAGGGSSSLNDTQLARMLQEEENAKNLRQRAQPSFHANDAELAWMLQEEENAKSLQQRAQSSFHSTNALAVQDARRELQRVLPPVRSVSTRPAASSSRMRILRNLQSRSNQHVLRGHQLGVRAVNASESLFHFPEGVDLDTRLEFLAAMETVSQEGFPMLAQVDRDFNENDYEMLLALDETNHVCHGVPYDRIEQLPVSVIKPTDVYEEICSICLEIPVVDDVVRRLPCMHGFHQQCIDVWLERQANCPICKVAI